MVRNDVCYLVKRTLTLNSIGVQTATETLTETPCRVDSVTSNEWANAGRLSMKPEFRAVVFYANYSDEEELEYDGKRYSIYRTYRNGNDIELYATKKAGV